MTESIKYNGYKYLCNKRWLPLDLQYVCLEKQNGCSDHSKTWRKITFGQQLINIKKMKVREFFGFIITVIKKNKITFNMYNVHIYWSFDHWPLRTYLYTTFIVVFDRLPTASEPTTFKPFFAFDTWKSHI